MVRIVRDGIPKRVRTVSWLLRGFRARRTRGSWGARPLADDTACGNSRKIKTKRKCHDDDDEISERHRRILQTHSRPTSSSPLATTVNTHNDWYSRCTQVLPQRRRRRGTPYVPLKTKRRSKYSVCSGFREKLPAGPDQGAVDRTPIFGGYHPFGGASGERPSSPMSVPSPPRPPVRRQFRFRRMSQQVRTS